MVSYHAYSSFAMLSLASLPFLQAFPSIPFRMRINAYITFYF
jgi:hypothetical protein